MQQAWGTSNHGFGSRESERQDETDPIAIVGIGCRYPRTLSSATALWDFVSRGGNAAVPDFPADRGWDLAALTNPDLAAAGSTYVRGGTFLDGAGDFDPSFFGISPREATAMDPQQRILLEISWEALEHAGIDPTTLAGTPVGVYFGVVAQEYGPRVYIGDADYAGHLTTGTTPSVASGRIAYSLGLEGPAVTVDTACSSSLAAVHFAVRALRAGECSVALAGGANVVCAPSIFVGFAHLGALAPDGQSKPFSADANGFGVSEGAGVLVLERLSDARWRGHNVLALLRGTAIGQDGASDGLSAPSEDGQRRVILAALADAGLSPADVDVVEAHGTGTKVGDPIEARALLATYGAARTARNPLLVGSLKSNIGHPQAAAGIAGVIKMIEAIRHAQVPGTVHLSRVTDAVDWSAGTIEVASSTVPWPATSQDRPRRAAVSSFGISGTNAHVIVEQAPPEIAREQQAREQCVVPLVVSAKTEAALRAQAAQLHAHLSERPQLGLADLAHTLTAGRAQFDHRAVVVAADRGEVLDGLAALAEGRPNDATVTGKATVDGGVVLVFPGQGSQWTDMASDLLGSSSVFAAQIEACDQAFAEFVDWSLIDVLRGLPDAPGLERVDVVQPALFAVMVSLARCWQALGIQPSAVIGHSQGEIAAAYIAGALSLRAAAKVVTLRSKVIVAIAGTGGMASVPLPADEVSQHLSRWTGRLAIAAINGPRSTVVSGDAAAIDELVDHCQALEIRARKVPVDYASHSPHVEALADDLHRALAGISPQPCHIDFISTVTGDRVDGTELDAEYWYRNLRQTVNFEQAVRAAHARGHRFFIESSAHPVLTVGVEDSLPDGTSNVVVGSLRRHEGSLRRLFASVAEVHVAGRAIDLRSYLGDQDPMYVHLPTYPFQRKRFWMSPGTAAADRQGIGHPLLTDVHDHPENDGLQFTGRLSLASHPWLADHAVNDVVLLPGAAMAELALFAGQQAGSPAVTEIVLQEPLVIPERDGVLIRVVVSEESADGRGVRIYSRRDLPDPLDARPVWTKHAEGLLGPASTSADPAVWPPSGAEPVDVSDGYDRLAARGYQYGPVFRGLRAVWRQGGDVYAEVALPEDANGFGLHPALLDAALHALEYVDPDRAVTSDQVRLPFAWAGIQLHAVGASVLRVRITASDADTYALTLTDPDGQLVCSVESLTLRPISRDRLLAAGTGTPDSLFGLEWTPITTPSSSLEWAEWPAVAGSGVSVLRCEPTGSTSELPELARQALGEVLRVTQQWLTDPRFDGGTLVVLTRRAISTGPGEDVLDLAHAPVWGLLRTAQTENPGRIVLVDVDDWSDDVVAAAVASGETQLAFRQGVARVPRVVRVAGSLIGGLDRLPSPDWQLRTLGEGTLEASNMSLAQWPDIGRPLASGEVRITVRAVGLNFRDVMIAYGLYPDPDVDLGNEGAGIVVEVAPDVTALQPGDRVMGTFFGIGPQVIRHHGFLTRFQASWSFEQAASTPAVFLTAYCALRNLAGLTSGQRLLVHAATGGVGLAAIQLARHWGAEVFATASTPKWNLLRSLGFDADHIASSRTCDFESQFLAATDGAGVDVVLNSLAGEFVDASLGLLPRGGHFIELGKTDIRDAAGIEHPGVHYQHFDLTKVGPAETQEMLVALGAMFSAGVLQPLPVSVRDVRQMPDALKFLGQARHTGKLALSVPRPLDPAGTVLITGGTGVLGAMLARHLVTTYGIEHLVLVSRSGPDTASAREIGDSLRALGADVRIVACDAAARSSLDAVLGEIPAAHPLTAVIHAAGVLDDGLFSSMSEEQVDRVLRPKLDAAWCLHEATRGLDLSAFVLFSSAAGILGNGGQANYAAANTFLDALAEHRRQLGLPATSMAWGMWAEATGMTGHLDDQDHARLRRTGFSAMSSAEGLALFDAALRSGRSLLIPARLDVAGQAGELPPILSGFARRGLRSASTGQRTPTTQQDFGAMTAAEQRTAIIALVRGVAATVLGHSSPDEVELDVNFKDVGFDSLGAVDFRNRLKRATGLQIATTAVFDHKTPAALAEHLLTLMAPAAEPAARAADSPPPAAPAAALAQPPAAAPARPALDAAPLTAAPAPAQSAADPAPAVRLSRYQRDIVAAALTYPDLPLAQPSGYVRLRGTADVDRMKHAIRSTALRHDAMRLRLEPHGDEYLQRVQPDYPDVEVVDFRAEPDPQGACQQWISRTTDTVIALDGPLTQTAILLDEADSLIVFCRFHHVVADAWGINLMIKETLETFHEGQTTTAPAPSCLDIVAADEEYRNSPDWKADRDVLVAAVSHLEPALFARKAAVRSHRRKQQSVHVEAHIADRVRQTGRSIFAVTAAALAAYLRRVHRDGDIVLGIPLLNRRTPAELQTMSDVTNILPLSVPVDERRTLLDLADQIRSDIWDLTGHQRFALGDLRTALRDEGRQIQTLFDVTYSYITDPGTDMESTVLASGYSLDAVNIVVREHQRDGSLDLEVFYADDVFDEDFSIEAAMAHVATLLDEGLRTETPLAGIKVLGDEESARIEEFERSEPVEFDETMTLDRLVAEQASRTPDHPAILGSETLTYKELLQRVDALAQQLRGIRPEECVPVLLPRSPDFLIAVHAILAAGGAYVPIDPQHPEDRRQAILNDCQARVIITEDLAVKPIVGPANQPRPSDLAYVIYTSGSTGTPKGVMIEHRSVVNRLTWMQRRYPLRDNDVILHKTPATFDVSVWELMWWALAGASVAVAPAGAERDPRELGAAIERHGVTVMHFVPSMLGPFLDHVEHAADQVRTLRLVFCSGEALTPALAERFRETLPGVQLVNLYGPTEATVDVSYFDIPRDGAIERVPIGGPIDNIALMVLDDAGRRCPIGVPGELNIAGVGVGRGYLGQPALTNEVFVVDESIPERRRYRTGDLARWLADGTIEYLGRLDDQVKIRGNRVTLGEVEHALTQCPDITAAVVVDENTDTGTRLIAYFVADSAVSIDSIVDRLADRLPPYMIPAGFVQLDELPLTRSGKVDRRALPALGRREHGSDQPSSPVERELADIWSQVLGSDAFGVHDDFFTVGGDSILVLRMRTEAEKRGLPFDIEQFNARPTIAGLAGQVATHEQTGEPAVAEPFELVPLIDRATMHDIEDAFPATQLQLGMLFHSLQRADSPLYKDVFRYRLRLPWYEDEFRDAYRRLVRRQPALRSNFDLTGRSTPLQIVFHDIPDTLEIAEAGDVEAYIEKMHHAPYALIDEQSRPAALHGMRVFVRPYFVDLVFSFHHAILDGWSVANLLSELLQDYLSHIGVDLPGVEQRPNSALLLAEYARAELQSRQDSAARTFWTWALEGAKATTIESTRAHVPAEDDEPRTMPLPLWLDRSVKQFARQHRVPMKSLLLTAHCLALSAMSGEDDVVTGCVTHARPDRADSELCAGLFLNTTPVRLNGSRRTWSEAVRRVVRWERDAFPHRRFPVSALNADRTTPVVETAFNFVNYHTFGEVLGEVELVEVAIREETNFALLTTALIDPRDGGISLRVSGETLTGTQFAEFGRLFIGILGEIVRNPDGEVDLRAARRADVTELVAQVATLHPAKIAIISDTGEWDYRRLDTTADTIARTLVGRGMPAGARVAIRMPRSAELVAVVLGAMRAGAAVVPLDPSYPEARIRSMIEIAEPYVTITDLGTLLDEPGEPVPLPRIHPEDIAYVLFTSGSTGEPKGVALPHRALTNLIEWQNRRATCGVGMTTLQFAPLSFDVSFQEIFSTLCGAGTLRVIEEDVRQDMVALLRTIDDSAVQRVYLPYVALQALAEVAVATGTYPASLRTIMSSGEQLRITPEIRALCAANPGTVLENQYGPTEAHVVLAHQLPAAVDDHPPLPPVGTPITATTVSLLDDRLQPVPPGVKGEIYIEGPCVAQGYEQRPGLTAQRFVAGPGGKVRYRTGDIGIALASGDIVCLGRADSQVKVRGFRVECAEVELAVLSLAAKHRGIEQVAVVPRALGGSDAVLQAFLVGDSRWLDAETLRSELREILPPHMVPSQYQWVDAMPLTPSGKRDDAALRALGSRGSGEAVSSGDELETAIAGLLAEFAGVSDLAVDTSFFDAGGTSIGATRVSMTIAKRWGVDLPLQTFLAAPTARELAAVVRSSNRRRTFDPVVALRDKGDQPPLFLVHPIGGNVFCYRELVKHLPGDRPVYGLQAAGAEPGTEPLSSMESLAASYIRSIRRVHPKGTFHLAGWSFGGYVAVEMARQLKDAEVATLTLLDTMALGEGPRPGFDEKQLIVLFFQELLWYSAGETDLGDGFDTAGQDADQLFESVFRRTIELGILPRDGSPQLLRRLYGVFRANYQATLGYRIEKTRRQLLVLRAAEELPSSFAAAHRTFGSMVGSPSNGWQRWSAQPVEVLEVPGNHLSMMDPPHVGVLASNLGNALIRADERADWGVAA